MKTVLACAAAILATMAMPHLMPVWLVLLVLFAYADITGGAK